MIFQLYKYTPNYRLFNYFIEPQKDLQDKFDKEDDEKEIAAKVQKYENLIISCEN